MRKLITLCAAVLFGSAILGAGIVSAASIPTTGTFSPGSNVGSVQVTLGGSLPPTRCGSAPVAGVVATSTDVTFIPTFSGCIVNSGIINPPGTFRSSGGGCAWDLNVTGATFNGATGATTGLALRICTTTLTSTAFPAGCVYTYPAQTITTNVTGQNRTTGNIGNAPPGAPGSFLLSLNNSPVRWTSSGCGLPTSGTGTFSMTWYFPGIYLGP